ncbi:MAG: hypothetical protein J6T91_03985 [Alphaproteobacteria bacterium]|nr:hypothetical protein [Alphaproteobacteria bacterium]
MLKIANIKSFDNSAPVIRTHIRSKLAGTYNINSQNSTEIFLIVLELTVINRA